MNQAELLGVLKREIERSTGCTDPGAVCLAVARATEELGQEPDHIDVVVSPNVYKNGVSVGVPGTGKRGLPIAAALGAVLRHSDRGLALLEEVTRENLLQAEQLVQAQRVRVRFTPDVPDPLYIRASVRAETLSASAIIAGDYSHIVEVTRNRTITFSAPHQAPNVAHDLFANLTLRELIELVTRADVAELKFLLDAARVNRQAAETGLSTKLGAALQRQMTPLPAPYSAMEQARLWTGAAGQARMSGLRVPILAIAGSGNHGIVNFLGPLAVAQSVNASEAQLACALAISSTVTVYIKGFIQRMTAFCGCAVAASPGVAASTVYLLGGDWNAMARAMQSVIGTLAGMVCDGAKESCAYKISTATATAIQLAYLAVADVGVESQMGIVGIDLEATIRNLGALNNPGMVETDRFLLDLIADSR